MCSILNPTYQADRPLFSLQTCHVLLFSCFSPPILAVFAHVNIPNLFIFSELTNSYLFSVSLALSTYVLVPGPGWKQTLRLLY